MKYENIKDELVKILNSLGYVYKLYDSDGSATSNPLESKYIFVKTPNMMFIVDDTSNSIELHKSAISSDILKKVLSYVRPLSKKYFVELHVSNYNQIIQPKKFSEDLLKYNYKRNKLVDSLRESCTIGKDHIEVFEGVVFLNNGRNIKMISGGTMNILAEDMEPFLPAIAMGIDHQKISAILERKEDIDKMQKRVKLESHDKSIQQEILDVLNKITF